MSPILIKLETSALRRVRQVDSLFTQAQWLVLSLSSILLIVLSEILLRCWYKLRMARREGDVPKKQ